MDKEPCARPCTTREEHRCMLDHQNPGTNTIVRIPGNSFLYILEVLSRRGDGVELCVVNDLIELNASNLRPNRWLLQVIPGVHFL